MRTMFELMDPIFQRTGRAVIELLCTPAVAHRYMAHCAAHRDQLYDVCLTGRERSDEAGRRNGFITYEAQITTAGWLALQRRKDTPQFYVEIGLNNYEFLGLELARHLERFPDPGGTPIASWRYEKALTYCRLQRARVAGDKASVAYLQRLRLDLHHHYRARQEAERLQTPIVPQR